MVDFQGIDAERMAQFEERLKQDILAEAEDHDGNILVPRLQVIRATHANSGARRGRTVQSATCLGVCARQDREHIN